VDENKVKILKYVSRGLKPPGVAYSQAVILWDFSVLIKIIMKNGEQVFGWLSENNDLWMIDEFEWLTKGGLQILAREHDITSLEVYE
jgi:hypothetical protein